MLELPTMTFTVDDFFPRGTPMRLSPAFSANQEFGVHPDDIDEFAACRVFEQLVYIGRELPYTAPLDCELVGPGVAEGLRRYVAHLEPEQRASLTPGDLTTMFRSDDPDVRIYALELLAGLTAA